MPTESCLWAETRHVSGVLWMVASPYGPVHFQAVDGVCLGRNVKYKLEEPCHK